jgi:hypothetical protein
MHTTTVNLSTGEIVQIPYTPEEQAEYDTKKAIWDASANDRKASEVRVERNAKLVQTDWTQISDATVDKQAWATYRQALRDITTQSGFPLTVTWPDAP